MLDELTRLATLLEDVSLNEEAQDNIRWRFNDSGKYTASSAIMLQFETAVVSEIAPLLWKG
jgi:hypothetical protein